MSRCRNDPPRALFLPFSLFLFFNQLFPPFSGRVSLAELGALTNPLSGLSYGRHYRRAHAPISHSRFSEPRTSENSHERAITPRASVAYTTIFFDQGFYYVRAFFFESREEALTCLHRFDRFTLAFLALNALNFWVFQLAVSFCVYSQISSRPLQFYTKF